MHVYGLDEPIDDFEGLTPTEPDAEAGADAWAQRVIARPPPPMRPD